MRLIACIIYTIIGFIGCPFLAWITFFTSLPMMLREIWQKPKKRQELLNIDDMADAVSGDATEKLDYSPENVGIFYGKGGDC